MAPAGLALLATVLAAVGAPAGCSWSGDELPTDATRVELPGVPDGVDLDDLTYSERLRTLLVPARGAGLRLVEPDSGRSRRVDGFTSADSADEGGGLVFVVDRERQRLGVVDPAARRIVASVRTRGRPDYVRSVGPNRELWVTIPGAGIQVFRAPASVRTPAPAAVGFIPLPPAAGGPEGITVGPRRNRAYVHLADGRIAAVDLRRHAITDTWSMGCGTSHGLPRVDERRGLLLAGCGTAGEVVLIDIDDGGRVIGRFRAGGGEAVLAHSVTTGHFFVRGDPGDSVVTLAASRSGLTEVRRTRVSAQGHCLVTDTRRHAWVCDPGDSSLVRLPDTAGPSSRG